MLHLSYSTDVGSEVHWMWTGEEIKNTSVAAHVIQEREYLQEMRNIGRENLVKAQKKQKRY